MKVKGDMKAAPSAAAKKLPSSKAGLMARLAVAVGLAASAKEAAPSWRQPQVGGE